jgi:hypothetical protein
LLILKLAIVENFGDGGVFALGNDDQVQPGFFCQLQGVAGID